MCLLLFSYNAHPRYRLVLAANRDEFYDRPTEPVAFWVEAPQVLAGRDLQAGGTWLGITRMGRLAAITNFRDPARHRAEAPSRGLLISRYLTGNSSPEEYVKVLADSGRAYNGYNVLLGDSERLFYYSNREGAGRTLTPGIYGLSNNFLDTPWPKVRKGKDALSEIMNAGREIDPNDLFAVLADRAVPDDSELPDTGIGRDWERVLSTLFISSPGYGTRSSTVVTVDRRGGVELWERVFNSHPEPYLERHFAFTIEDRER